MPLALNLLAAAASPAPSPASGAASTGPGLLPIALAGLVVILLVLIVVSRLLSRRSQPEKTDEERGIKPPPHTPDDGENPNEREIYRPQPTPLATAGGGVIGGEGQTEQPSPLPGAEQAPAAPAYQPPMAEPPPQAYPSAPLAPWANAPAPSPPAFPVVTPAAPPAPPAPLAPAAPAPFTPAPMPPATYSPAPTSEPPPFSFPSTQREELPPPEIDAIAPVGDARFGAPEVALPPAPAAIEAPARTAFAPSPPISPIRPPAAETPTIVDEPPAETEAEAEATAADDLAEAHAEAPDYSAPEIVPGYSAPEVAPEYEPEEPPAAEPAPAPAPALSVVPPLAPAPVEFEPVPAAAAPPAIVEAGAAGAEPELILLIEDDERIAKFYMILFQAKGFRVENARDGVEGVDMAQALNPALILLDVMMPKMNGLMVLQTLRANPETEKTPVVVLSNYMEPPLIQRALQLGAIEYVVKSQARPEQLVSALPSWLKGEPALH